MKRHGWDRMFEIIGDPELEKIKDIMKALEQAIVDVFRVDWYKQGRRGELRLMDSNLPKRAYKIIEGVA